MARTEARVDKALSGFAKQQELDMYPATTSQQPPARGRVAIARVARKEGSPTTGTSAEQVHIDVAADGAALDEQPAAVSDTRTSDVSQHTRRESARLAAGRSTWLVNSRGELRIRDQRARRPKHRNARIAPVP